jgi:hypothetical protein
MKQLAETMANQNHEVIILDNASTYEPLLEYYNNCPFKVHRLPNLGKNALWDSGIYKEVNEYFVYTDSDLDVSMVPEDWVEVLMEGFDRFPDLLKSGLSWEENTAPQENPAFALDSMPSSIAWQNKLDGGWWGYPIDTSFAINKPQTPFTISGVRKDRPYTGLHLPWHIVLEPSKDVTKKSVLFDDEILYYFEHAENSSFTLPRLTEMIKEYKRRKNAS